MSIWTPRQSAALRAEAALKQRMADDGVDPADPAEREAWEAGYDAGGTDVMTSLDNDGVDRRTYEPPNCGSTRAHDQHFHSPIGGLTLNCPGKAPSPDQEISRVEVERILDAWYDRYRRASRIDEDTFLALRNQLVPLASGEPVQFQYRFRQRWLNGTFEGPVDNPDDPYREGDVWVTATSRTWPAAMSRRVQVFLSSVRRLPGKDRS